MNVQMGISIWSIGGGNTLRNHEKTRNKGTRVGAVVSIQVDQGRGEGRGGEGRGGEGRGGEGEGQGTVGWGRGRGRARIFNDSCCCL